MGMGMELLISIKLNMRILFHCFWYSIFISAIAIQFVGYPVLESRGSHEVELFLEFGFPYCIVVSSGWDQKQESTALSARLFSVPRRIVDVPMKTDIPRNGIFLWENRDFQTFAFPADPQWRKRFVHPWHRLWYRIYDILPVSIVTEDLKWRECVWQKCAATNGAYCLLLLISVGFSSRNQWIDKHARFCKYFVISWLLFLGLTLLVHLLPQTFCLALDYCWFYLLLWSLNMVGIVFVLSLTYSLVKSLISEKNRKNT